MTIMGIVARDNNIDITGTELNITKIMAADPRRVSEVVAEFVFPNKTYTDDEKKIIESVAGTSPVPLSVSPNMTQSIKMVWPEK